MPLLGRHKSLGSGQASKARQQQQQAQPLVCESPLFGVRRQLPVASASTADASSSSSSAPGHPLSPSMSLTHNLGGARQHSSRHESNKLQQQQQQQLAEQMETLSSIPKQITRQQIHYAFSIMDTNSDGLIDLRDLSQMLANLGVPIDEAILSHVMSSVSKRGDHLINENEFLDWIGEFIQVCDAPAGAALAATETYQRSGEAALGPRATRGRKLPIARSASSGAQAAGASSLVAHSPEAQFVIDQQMKQRRGSGSGLALMRSLSSSAAPAGLDQTGARRLETSAAGSPTRPEVEPSAGQAQLLEQQQEARNDLKAAFCVFDLDGDGFITIDEVRQGLRLLGETWSQQELNQVFSRCNRTPSGPPPPPVGQKASKSSKKAAKVADLGQRISIDDFVQLLL